MFLELEPVFNNIGLSKQFETELDLSELELYGDTPFKTPVHLSGSVSNEVGVVKLRAAARCTLESSCCRCTAEIRRSAEFPVEHILVTSLNNEENDNFVLIKDMHFNLDELAIEDIVLAYPLKMLCSEECKGLCPQCGKNLNEGACSCTTPVDPRLAALLELIDE